MLTIGCHLSASEGFLAMGKTALSIGANTFQFFTRNPRGSKAKAIDPDDATAFLALAQANGFNLTLADIISDGEEFSCNQTKSTNGGNPMPYDCFDDSYEMFLLSL